MAKQQRHLPKARLLVATTSILLLIAAAVIWILNSEHIIRGDWSNIFPIIFLVLAALLALLQWLFPLSSNEPVPPLSSNLTLIDAALDPHDSPYEQTIENGRKKIKYKGEKPKKVDKDN
jgi:hypothetical protein